MVYVDFMQTAYSIIDYFEPNLRRERLAFVIRSSGSIVRVKFSDGKGNYFPIFLLPAKLSESIE